MQGIGTKECKFGGGQFAQLFGTYIYIKPVNMALESEFTKFTPTSDLDDRAQQTIRAYGSTFRPSLNAPSGDLCKDYLGT